MEDEESKPHIIIDNGSNYCKAGFSGKDGPKAVFPTNVGYPIYPKIGGDKTILVGEDAYAKKSILKLNFPIIRGFINNWDEMEIIWSHIFTNELKVDPTEYNVMLTQTPMNPKENNEKMAQIMFEKFNVPGLYLAQQAVLSLYTASKFSGIVAELGDGVTQFVPIFDGYSLPHAIICLDLAGSDITEYMLKLLKENGQIFSTNNEKILVSDIKEKVCSVALDFKKELKYLEPFYYKLPDDTEVIIKDQRIRCPEALFKPYLINKTCYGIGITCNDSILKCDIDVRKDLYNGIVLSGGNSMFNGLPERFAKEIKSLASEYMKEEVKVIASPERKFGVWIGGSILSSISTFESMWITKKEYEESGATIVHSRCFM